MSIGDHLKHKEEKPPFILVKDILGAAIVSRNSLKMENVLTVRLHLLNQHVMPRNTFIFSKMHALVKCFKNAVKKGGTLGNLLFCI